MTLWVRLGLDPPRGFYAGEPPAGAPPVSYPRLLAVGTLRWGAHLEGGDEAANCQILLDNGDRELTGSLAEASALALEAVVYDDDTAVFSGLVARVRTGSEIALDLVADGLSQRLALRRTRVWPAPFVDAVIPHVIGRQSLKPIRYSSDGRRWLLADHACARVLSVTLDGEPLAGFALANTRDELGHAIALLQLNEPVSDYEELICTVEGLLNASGELLQNPAEVLVYLVATLGGQALTLSRLDAFRAECARAGIRLNMLINDDAATYRAEIDRIMQNAGGIWSPGMPGFARLAPLSAMPANEPLYLELTSDDDVHDAESALDDIATELTLEFDADAARGRFRQSITLRAEGVERAFGRRPLSVQAGALSTRREALALGERLLAWYARPRWRQRVTVSGPRALAVAPGTFIDVTATHLPVAGWVRVTDVERVYADNSATLELEQATGSAPAIVLVQASQLAEPFELPAAVAYLDGVAVITARAPDGSLLPGARVTLDGVTRISNARGEARFVIAPGVYELRIAHPDYEEIVIDDYRVGL